MQRENGKGVSAFQNVLSRWSFFDPLEIYIAHKILMHLLPLIGATLAFVIYLIYERVALQRRRDSIPLRIAVTGTRGKSSVTRLIASMLREDGRIVVAKTTGSQARLILPNAEETEITRRGIPSIIEQKKLIRKAARLKADCLVAEIMSIHAENHFVESQQILQPHVVVITNLRPDHAEAMGESKEEIAAVYCQDISEKAKVFVLEKDNHPLFASMVAEMSGELLPVHEGMSSPLVHHAPKLNKMEFTGNLDLVCALAEHLRIDQKVVLNGVLKTKQDIGELRIWKYRSRKTNKTCYLANGFAANDPESTLEVIERVKELLPAAPEKFIGLLSLRADRPDRSAQWIDILSGSRFDCLSTIYVMGTHAGIFQRRLKTAKVLKSKPPEEMMETILAGSDDRSVIVGFGNMKGAGELLVDFWNKEGEAHEL
jgi:poly-gamma-glutamate synthase PgsB/CapB